MLLELVMSRICDITDKFRFRQARSQSHPEELPRGPEYTLAFDNGLVGIEEASKVLVLFGIAIFGKRCLSSAPLRYDYRYTNLRPFEA